MLQAQGIYKSYGTKVALAGIDLTVDEGEICGLLGPNGAGKSTFASIVAGLRRPDRGRITIDDIDVVRRPYDARAKLGYAPQELAIYPLASVRENLALFGALAGLGGRRLQQRIADVADLLGMEHLMGRQAGQTSGGEQRRLHTAMALLHRPKVLLLDEPTVGADVESRGRILDFVRQLAAEGTAVCYSTHYLTEVEDLDATVALINQGQIIARGGVRALVAQHASSVVELRFTGAAPPLAIDGCSVINDGEVVRISSHDPSRDAAAALRLAASLGGEVQSVDFIRPSLDSVFLSLTGTRLKERDAVELEEDVDVVAS